MSCASLEIDTGTVTVSHKKMHETAHETSGTRMMHPGEGGYEVIGERCMNLEGIFIWCMCEVWARGFRYLGWIRGDGVGWVYSDRRFG